MLEKTAVFKNAKTWERRGGVIKIPRGQAAMEFLMTYGWALLIVLIAIAILAAFGVFSSKRGPEGCILGPGLSCQSFKIGLTGPFADDGRIEMMVTNGIGSMKEFLVTLDPTGRMCPGITGFITSNTLKGNPSPAIQAIFNDPGVADFPQDSTRPLVRVTFSPYYSNGIDCNSVGANCCSGYNAMLNDPGTNPPATFNLPCKDGDGNTLPINCGIGPVGSGIKRLPSAGNRVKLDLFFTYQLMTSSLVHSRKGVIFGIVEAQP